MAKATVDKSVCIGCGVCTAIASAVFAIAADGLAENVLGDEVPADAIDAVNEAQVSCPVEAISVED